MAQKGFEDDLAAADQTQGPVTAGPAMGAAPQQNATQQLEASVASIPKDLAATKDPIMSHPIVKKLIRDVDILSLALSLTIAGAAELAKDHSQFKGAVTGFGRNAQRPPMGPTQ